MTISEMPIQASMFSNPLTTRFEELLRNGKDSALLRFSLGNEYLKTQETTVAVSHLQQAVLLDPSYSAAWKLLGKALTETAQFTEALEAYRQGIIVAEGKGDKQAAKEMSVFAKRIANQLADSKPT